MVRSWLVVIALASAASAEPAPNRLTVEVGKTVEYTVGYMRGYFCDDPSLVTAQVITRGNTNIWIVTGAKPGTTQCRVGDLLHPHLLFDVIVTAAKAPSA